MSYIKIHRKILDWEWYNDANTFRLFTHLLLKANFKSNRWQGVEILPGQLVTGRKVLADELRLSEQEIRTSLNKLKSTNEITIKSTNKFSIVTICKWLDYQDKDIADQPTEQPSEQLSSNQQSTTLKEGKERKEEKKNISVNFSASFEAFRCAYPGTKRGLKTELDNFLKRNKPETIALLLPALDTEKRHRESLQKSGLFIPQWKNMATWINQKCWEQVFPEANETEATNNVVEKLPEAAFVREFDFDSLNAQRLNAIHQRN